MVLGAEAVLEKKEILRDTRFGERIAEEELNELEQYFVATDQWNSVFSGEVDIVYGAKGAGKSAIYALIDKKRDELFDRGVVVKGAESIRGNTVFTDLIISPPPSERSFVDLWKLYFLILSASVLREYGFIGDRATVLIEKLEESGLLPKNKNPTLGQIFASAKKHIWEWIFPEVDAIETTIAIDSASGMPIVTRKKYLKAKEIGSYEQPIDIPFDDLIGFADDGFRENGYCLWILFDRLDVAFNDTPELERNALRALFRMYNDFKRYENIRIKIFVRDDIWERISEGGFAEASHITKTTKVEWNSDSLLSLFVKRFLSNESIRTYLSASLSDCEDDFQAQKKILERVFPDKIETGKNPETFRWMVNRIQDGSGKPAPRELIHLLETIRRLQVTRLEQGQSAPADEILFDRPVFKPALKEVSKVRYEQTFVAENPTLKAYTDKLKGQKAEQNANSLAKIWGENIENAREVAERLINAGFFEKRENNGEIFYWVPFLYRDALELVQGKAPD